MLTPELSCKNFRSKNDIEPKLKYIDIADYYKERGLPLSRSRQKLKISLFDSVREIMSKLQKK